MHAGPERHQQPNLSTSSSWNPQQDENLHILVFNNIYSVAIDIYGFDVSLYTHMDLWAPFGYTNNA